MFYVTYLEARPGPRYETHVVRSKDLIRWESSPLNPVLVASEEDSRIANPKLTAEQRKKISGAVDRTRESSRRLYSWAEKSEVATPFVAEESQRSYVVGTVDFADGSYFRNFEALGSFTSGSGNDTFILQGRVNQNLGVRLRGKAVTTERQPLAQVAIVVQLTVEDDRYILGFVPGGLVAAGQVDDAQPAHPQRESGRARVAGKKAFCVGTSMTHRRGHRTHARFRFRAA